MRRFRLSRFWLEFRKNPRTGVDVRYKERAPEYVHGGDCHPFWELMYVDRGAVRLRVGEGEHELRPGDFILIAPNCAHSVLPADAAARFYVTAHFDTNLKGLETLAGGAISADEEGRRLVVALIKEKESDQEGGEFLALAYLAQFLLRLRRCRAAAPGVAAPTYFQSNSERSVVAKAVDFMNRRYAEPLTLDRIAAESGVSNSHLEHLFKRRMETPVMAYLQGLRIEHAKALLLESASNVSGIAHMCGYSSVFLFSRRFKQVVGVSPSQYARMVRPPSGEVSSGGQKLGRTG
jgi:AraC-like DNA-binding protein